MFKIVQFCLNYQLRFLFADSSKDIDAAKESKSRKESLGVFYNSPHYMKLYDVLRGAYANYKVLVSLILYYWLLTSAGDIQKFLFVTINWTKPYCINPVMEHH